MAKFRKNHQKEEYRGSYSNPNKKSVKYIIWFCLITALMYVLTRVDVSDWDMDRSSTADSSVSVSGDKASGVERNFLPTSTTADVIHHKYYTLSYSEEHEQPEWVAYKLTKDNLRKQRVPRAKKFKPDKAVATTSAYHKDYSHSGYTRGHMAPAGDMAFSKDAMRESFYMSNMTPQVKEFNGGIWRELEETVRDWAEQYGELYVVSGPVLKSEQINTKIGRNEVSVPSYNYKVILYNNGKDSKATAYLMPNEKSTKTIKNYQVTIDEIEDLTGIDFFADFLDPSIEQSIEANLDTKSWKYQKKRFKKRLNKWNNF